MSYSDDTPRNWLLAYFAGMAEGQGLLAAAPMHDWVIIAANWSLMPIRTN